MLYLILLIFYFIFFFILAIKNLKWAIFLLVLALPSYLIRFHIWGLPMTLLEGMIICLFIVWLIKTIKHESIKALKYNIKYWILDIRYLIIFVVLFLLSATIAIFVGPEPRAAAGIWKAYFIEPILFFIILTTTLKKEDLKKVLAVLALSAFVLAVVAIYQKITGELIANDFWAAEATRRVMSVFEYPNGLALYLSPLATIFIGFAVIIITKKNKSTINNQQLTITQKQSFFSVCWSRLKKNLFVICYLLFVMGILLAVYFTRSKGALLGVLAGLFFYVFFYRGYRKYYLAMLAAIFIFLFLFFNILNVTFDWRGQATVAGGDSLTTRMEMWGETWQMLRERPIIGAGLAGYQLAVAPYHSRNYIEIYLYPHNEFLNFWSETGLLGLVSWILIISWFFKEGLKLLKNIHKKGTKGEGPDDLMAVSLMGGMIAILIHGLVDVPYFKNDLSVLFWLLIGMMIVLCQKNIGENETNKV